MKKQIFKVKNTQVNLADLKAMLKQQSEVSAAYLFGSAAKGESMVNDLDIMVLLHRHVDKHQVYFNLTHKLSQVTNNLRNGLNDFRIFVSEIRKIIIEDSEKIKEKD